jgi:hypothetical protein
MRIRILNEWGFILLAIFLILWGLFSLVPAFGALWPLVALIAIIAGVLILIGR